MVRPFLLVAFLVGAGARRVTSSDQEKLQNAVATSPSSDTKSTSSLATCLNASDVAPPWKDMYKIVGGETRCQSCAQSLQKQGLLQAGWECTQADSYLGPFDPNPTWSIARPATNTKFNAMSPVRSFSLNQDTDGAGPMLVGGSTLPKSLRGVFWLTSQGNLSALMSFGGPNADGAWSSAGHLLGLRYRVRVGGDRVWALAGSYDADGKPITIMDLVYEFTFNDATNPTHGQIHITMNKAGISLGRWSEWLLDFQMELLPSHDDYPGSVVWSRKSYVFTFEMKSARYDLVQVVDEHGHRIQPAWDKFVEFQTSSSVKNPGTLNYHSSVADDSEDITASLEEEGVSFADLSSTEGIHAEERVDAEGVDAEAEEGFDAEAEDVVDASDADAKDEQNGQVELGVLCQSKAYQTAKDYGLTTATSVDITENHKSWVRYQITIQVPDPLYYRTTYYVHCEKGKLWCSCKMLS